MHSRQLLVAGIVLLVASVVASTGAVAQGGDPGVEHTQGGDLEVELTQGADPDMDLNSPPDDDDPNVCGYFTAYEVSIPGARAVELTIERFFSRDREIRVPDGVKNRRDYLEREYKTQCDDFAPTDNELRAIAADQSFQVPVGSLPDFNAMAFGRLPTTGTDRVLVPANVSTTNQTFIKDAYGIIHSINPSTTLIETNRTLSGWPIYTSERPLVRAYSDFRVTRPEGDSSGPVQYSYSIDSVSRSGWCLRADSNVSAGCNDEAAELRDQADQRRIDISGETTITAIMNVTLQATNRTRTCTDWNRSENKCDGEWNTTRTSITESVTVTDTETVRVAPRPNISIRAAQFPDGTYRLYVEFHNRVSALRLRGENYLTTPYRFVYYTDPIWDDVRSRSASGQERVMTGFHPVNTYAFPSVAGPTYQNMSNSEDIEFSNVEIGRIHNISWDRDHPMGPDVFPHGVNVSVRNGTWRYPDVIRIRDEPTFKPSEMEAIGLVPSARSTVGSKDQITIEFVKDVKQPEISDRRVANLRRGGVLEVLLWGANGSRVNTSNRSGYIATRNTVMNTTNGTVDYRYYSKNIVRFEYYPQPWYVNASQPAYTSAEYLWSPNANNAFIVMIFLSIEFFFILVLPCLVAIWMIDKVPGIDVWPPWRYYQE